MPAIGVFRDRRKREARRIAAATNRSSKAKAAELRSAAKAKLDPKLFDRVASKACALHVFDFDFFFFFFAMTLFLHLPLVKNYGLGDMNAT
ncbi:MAG: hypothetical protein WAL37_06680 [Xanthobacteraceae bacterium]